MKKFQTRKFFSYTSNAIEDLKQPYKIYIWSLKDYICPKDVARVLLRLRSHDLNLKEVTHLQRIKDKIYLIVLGPETIFEAANQNLGLLNFTFFTGCVYLPSRHYNIFNFLTKELFRS